MTCAIRSSISLANLDLDELNQRFETAHPKEILGWCVKNIPTGLVQSTAFGATGMVILDLIYRVIRPYPPVPVLFIDTLHHFQETLEFAGKAKRVYNVDLHIYQTLKANNREAFAALYGDELWNIAIEKFHYLTKVEPFERGLEELQAVAWINGRRRDQAHTRADIPIFERDQQGRLKINPLATWTRKETWKYIVEHNVIYNPLHDLGYTSIGDEPLTTPVGTGEDERAGRWRGSEKTECGLHL
jgi:phosphoadenosine phosphosulfate reductase